MNIKPLGDRVVVKPFPQEEVTKVGSSSRIPSKEKPQQGEVLAVGRENFGKRTKGTLEVKVETR